MKLPNSNYYRLTNLLIFYFPIISLRHKLSTRVISSPQKKKHTVCLLWLEMIMVCPLSLFFFFIPEFLRASCPNFLFAFAFGGRAGEVKKVSWNS
jgi:hypothetical protein